MTLGEQLVFLRKQKGVTQEELATHLGITNQAVSKWEGGICCPDIQLLPALCAYFGVSADELLGCGPEKGYEQLYLEIKKYFEAAPREQVFALAASLAGLLHECASTYGYREEARWDTSIVRGVQDGWGYSMRFEADGVTAHRGGSVFISDSRRETPMSADAARALADVLAPFTNARLVRIFYAIYDITVGDMDRYATAEEIAERAQIRADKVEEVLETETLPVTEKAGIGYRIDGMYMHLAPMLKLLTWR